MRCVYAKRSQCLNPASTRQVYLTAPTAETVTHYLQVQSTLPFSYIAVGATQRTPPTGYLVDHNQIQLGRGLAVYRQACAALQQWEMFNLGWLQICWPTTPQVPGATVGVVAQALGLQFLNACRIVYTIHEENAAGARLGFAYGTLPGHVERGEERFLIEWRRDDTVWYDILAFSQPNHWLVRLGYPLTRYFQKRFARDSKAAMWRMIHGN